LEPYFYGSEGRGYFRPFGWLDEKKDAGRAGIPGEFVVGERFDDLAIIDIMAMGALGSWRVSIAEM